MKMLFNIWKKILKEKCNIPNTHTVAVFTIQVDTINLFPRARESVTSLEGNLAIPIKITNSYTLWPSNCIPKNLAKKHICSCAKGIMQQRNEMKTTWMSFCKRMINKLLHCPAMGYYSALKKNEANYKYWNRLISKISLSKKARHKIYSVSVICCCMTNQI